MGVVTEDGKKCPLLSSLAPPRRGRGSEAFLVHSSASRVTVIGSAATSVLYALSPQPAPCPLHVVNSFALA